MPFNDITLRSDAEPLIPEDVSREIFENAIQRSGTLPLMRRLPNMSRKLRRLPVRASLPTAYFVEGEPGLKQTTKVSWENKFITAEELAVIATIPEQVLADLDYDFWPQVQGPIEEAIAKAIDQAILFGINKPTTWPVGIVSQAITAGNTISFAAAGDLYDKYFGPGGVMSKVELDGYMVNGFIHDPSMMGQIRGMRDAVGQPLFHLAIQNNTTSYSLYGQPSYFPMNGSMDPATALSIAGDWQKAVYSIRQDIEWKIADQAIIQDDAGLIANNLFQEDMIAIRATIRLGWALPNPVNRMNSNSATRCPFAVVVP